MLELGLNETPGLVDTAIDGGQTRLCSVFGHPAKPYFRGKRLLDIRRDDALKFRTWMLDNGMGRRTVNKALSLPGTLFNHARKSEQVHHQPVFDVMLPKDSEQDDDDDFEDDEIEVLSLAEQRRLIAAADGG